jgi:hypothetical protein
MLASFADDPTGSPLPERKGALCAPADPAFDGKAFNNLMQATQTDVGDWACPVTRDVEVRALPRPNAPVIEKLGMVLHRPAGSVMCWWTPWLRSAMTRSAASRTRVGGRSVVISAVATHNRHEI